MPEVTIKNLYSKTIHCKVKTEKLLNVLLSETDWMHACGQKGKCTTCTVIVLEGQASLGEYTEAEERFLSLGKLTEGNRLACQATVHGNVTIQAPETYKLPHLDYSE